jgi:thioredoxin-related protein
MRLVIFFLILMVALQGCTSEKPEDSTEKYTEEQIEELARCLTEKDNVMYGAYWCSYCQKTKEKFGISFGYVNYVECDPKCKPDEDGKILSVCEGHEGQPEVCLERDITSYPTWIFSDNSRKTGDLSFEVLDEKSGCNLLPKTEE